MLLNFKIHTLKQGSKVLDMELKAGGTNAFIIVGEEEYGGKKYFKSHQLGEKLIVIPGVKLDEQAYRIPVEDFEPLGGIVDETQLDIPKEYLTMEIVEEIQRLNSDEVEEE